MSSSAEAAAPELQSARESKRAKTSHMEAPSQTQTAPGQAGLATMASVNTSHTSHTSHTAGGSRSKRGGGPAAGAAAAAATTHVSEYRYSASNVFARMQTGLQAVEGLLFDQAHTFALLDHRPVARGHALLIVKHPAATLLDLGLNQEAAGQVLLDLQVLAKAVQAATGCAGLKVLQNSGPYAGQTVPQLHFHVIPVYPDSPGQQQQGQGQQQGQRQGRQQQQGQQQQRSDGAPSADGLKASDLGEEGAGLLAAPAASASGQQVATGPAPKSRPWLAETDPGPLVAAVRNLLPVGYAPGFYAWAPDCEAMEALGSTLQQHLGWPGSVLQLDGHLGAGKSTICRGFVRSAMKAPLLDVPSPTFLLCLSYKEDLAHDAAARAAAEGSEQAGLGAAAEGQGQEAAGAAGAAAPATAAATGATAAATAAAPTVHHMDPYRLGAKVDKMAGLIDFESAFKNDVCLVEWPDRMPAEVMKLPRRGISVSVSGTGIQAAGRLVCIQPLTPDDPSAKVLAAWRQAGAWPQPRPFGTASATATGPVGPDAATNSNSNLNSSGALASVKPLPSDPSAWLVLGIESSCDDTAAAVVTGDGRVLAHRIASQAGLHEQFGGIKPDVARDAHARAIHDTVSGCLKEAGVEPGQLTAVAVTVGPGLSLCLQVGVQSALTLAAEHRLPVVPVHHMEAHALMTRLPTLNPQPPTFPALLLLVSGGHNMLVLTEGVGRHRIIGTTLDDSVGECFDKVARLLGITAIPGGPHLERLAEAGEQLLASISEEAAAAAAAGVASPADAAAAGARAAAAELSKFELTMPMQTGQHRDGCNFSFSGLKTGAAKLIEGERLKLGLPAQAYCGPGSGVKPAPASAPAPSPASAPTTIPAPGAATAPASGAGAGAGASGGSAASGVVAIGTMAAADSEAPEEVQAQLRRSTSLIAASLQRVSVRFLQQRARRALQWLSEDSAQHGGPPVSCLVIAGGVAANKAVRAGLEAVATEFGVPCLCPPVKYCMDNGLMVAWTGVERLKLGLYRAPPPSVEAVPANVDVLPRWPIGPVDPRSASGMKHIKAFH